jgi:hypothetical protein
MMNDEGWPSRSFRPDRATVLNELNVIVAEGAEKASKVIVYSTEEVARKLPAIFGR